MSAADAPELLSREQLSQGRHHIRKGYTIQVDGRYYIRLLDQALAYHGVHDRAADLAAKLEAAERERKHEHDLVDDLLKTCSKLTTRAARAEAALVAAQEAMRAMRNALQAAMDDVPGWYELARESRALPIPAAKPEGE